MEDYFHLNLKKFAEKSASASKGPQPSAARVPSAGSVDEDTASNTHKLNVGKPAENEDNTDPYNSTGKFNSKNLSW